MQFNSEVNNLDLYSEARSWCGIDTSDTTTLSIAEFTRSANFGMDRVVSLALKADGKWQFDDANNSGELLDVSTDLVSGTSNYSILVTWLKIKKVRIKDSGGTFVTLTPIDRRQLTDNQLTADAGDPKRYDKLGNYLYLHPKPNYGSSGGLEVQYQRGASYFVVGDTTKVPGFNVNYHRMIALYGALDFCEKNDLEKRTVKIQSKIIQMETEFLADISDRDADQKVGLRTTQQDYGQSQGGGNRDGFNI